MKGVLLGSPTLGFSALLSVSALRVPRPSAVEDRAHELLHTQMFIVPPSSLVFKMQVKGHQAKMRLLRLLPSCCPSYHTCQHPCSHSRSLSCQSRLPVPRCLSPCHSRQIAPCGCQCTCWCPSAGSHRPPWSLSVGQRVRSLSLLPSFPPLSQPSSRDGLRVVLLAL